MRFLGVEGGGRSASGVPSREEVPRGGGSSPPRAGLYKRAGARALQPEYQPPTHPYLHASRTP